MKISLECYRTVTRWHQQCHQDVTTTWHQQQDDVIGMNIPNVPRKEIRGCGKYSTGRRPARRITTGTHANSRSQLTKNSKLNHPSQHKDGLTLRSWIHILTWFQRTSNRSQLNLSLTIFPSSYFYFVSRRLGHSVNTPGKEKQRWKRDLPITLWGHWYPFRSIR